MWTCQLLVLVVLIVTSDAGFKRKQEKIKCPKVNPSKSLDLQQILGFWYVVEYYASSQEDEIYRCMRALFSLSPDDVEITMNFTYNFKSDPDNEKLYGNITWRIPNLQTPTHWVHNEGIYNAYVLDMDANGDKSWALLLQCAEKSNSTRYLTSFILSRQPILPPNVISFLRDKLPRYDVDLQYMFNMTQTDCTSENIPAFFQTLRKLMKPPAPSTHPLKT